MISTEFSRNFLFRLDINILVDITPHVRRGLLLMSKILQNLANGVEFGKFKEAFMTPTNLYVVDHFKPVNDFLEKISVIIVWLKSNH